MSMTENEKYLEMPWSIEETIENLKIIKEHLSATVLKTNLDGKGKQDAKEVEFDFNRAIQALEEIQQYEAIGTIEELKALKEKGVDMSIDEAIEHAKEVAKQKYAEGMLCHANPNDDLLDGCIKCAKEHEQLAEWLEELKERRRMMKKYGHCTDNLETEIRNKAIDEIISFSKGLEYHHDLDGDWYKGFRSCILRFREKAEQMKEGAV